MSAADGEVLIVGAGPTGLTLAVDLARRGVKTRVVEKGAALSVHSKALVVQARTLEVLEDLGVVEEALAASQPVWAVEANDGPRQLFVLRFPDVDGPYPRPVVLRQSQTEKVLFERLRELGGAVEWNTELRSFVDEGDRVRVTLRRAKDDEEGGVEEEELACAYLAGCDGSHSAVRQGLGLAFEGKTYDNDFLQVDTHIAWDREPGRGRGFLTDDGVMVILPLGGDIYRIIRVRRERPEDAPDEPSLAEFQADVDRWVPGGARLHDPEWLIRFRLHERLAERFRVGRVFVLGDAAHIHTPAGGQGMNTGIQDAHNLGWKLGLALQHGTGDALLDSYEAERRPVAADVLKFTDRAFRLALAGDTVFRRLLQRIGPRIMRTEAAQGRLARRVSQIDVDLRHGPLGFDGRPRHKRSGPRPGDRAPDAILTTVEGPRSLFELMDGARSTVLVLDAGPKTDDALAELRAIPAWPSRVLVVGDLTVPPDTVADEEGELAERYRPAKGEILVIRPDGYLGLRVPDLDTAAVKRWVGRLGLPVG